MEISEDGRDAFDPSQGKDFNYMWESGVSKDFLDKMKSIDPNFSFKMNSFIQDAPAHWFDEATRDNYRKQKRAGLVAIIVAQIKEIIPDVSIDDAKEVVQ